ncbi:MAG: aldehyde ferredoxin oxidoreductase family protein [Anaerolineales bacterium]|nr:aldehyde ferredoxin oxidoreductase family protein [Anaerolineales bacterium]
MQPILTVNLTTGEIGEFAIPEDWQRDFLGGASLAARILYDALTPELDPLSPEAPLLLLNGPLSGTSGPTVGRFVICAKSPATHLWGESNIGGFWGPELRKTGYDGVLVTGRSEKPVYLSVLDGGPELRPANHLWGLDTYASQDQIVTDLDQGKVRVVTIGPAGESGIPYALILCDHGRVAGRTGMGAVMGSKNLKAIAVKGKARPPLARPDAYKQLRSAANRDLAADNMTSVLRSMGTAATADYFDYLGEMPKQYFSRGVMEGTENITGATVTETILSGVSACHACVVACGRVVTLEDEQERKGPEYETLVGFGPNLGLSDAAVATRLGELCDRYGMDTISASGTIGLAFQLFADGVIAEADTGGLRLEWGDAAVVEELIHLIVRREGFGAKLAEGSRALEQCYGLDGAAVQVNGLEVAYHDPRAASGMALVYATSPRGACHNQSDYFMVDIGGAEETLGIEFFDRHAGAEKAANVARHQNWRTLFNSLVMCIFGNVPPQRVLALINAACGYDLSLDEMLAVGERGWNLKRAINNRLGLTRANDKLPKALLKTLPDGGSEGYQIDLAPMLEAYYRARGWDLESGYPSREKLQALGLDWVAADLWPEN